MSALETIKIDIGKKFIGYYHNEEKKELTLELENEKWVPFDIEFEYYDIIAYILNEKKIIDCSEEDLSISKLMNTERLLQEDSFRNSILFTAE